jgi:hypothetical protein
VEHAPAFTVDGKILLIMAAFKAHAALNFWRGQELARRQPTPMRWASSARLRRSTTCRPTELDG